MAEIGKGVVNIITNNVAWGTFEYHKHGLETFDIPINDHHSVGDEILWMDSDDGGDIECVMIINDLYASIYRIKIENGGLFVEDQITIDKQGTIIT